MRYLKRAPRHRGLSQERRPGHRTPGHPVEAAPPPAGPPPGHLAAVKRGLKRGLKGRVRTVVLMLDETIITETPPLYSCYGHIGEQVRVPITGNRSKRILHGAINVRTGDVSLLITEEWTKETHQAFLSMIRSHWRGWNIVLFEDRAGAAHVAGQPGVGRGVGDRGPPAAEGHAGVERDGPPVEAHQAGDGGRAGRR